MLICTTTSNCYVPICYKNYSYDVLWMAESETVLDVIPLTRVPLDGHKPASRRLYSNRQLPERREPSPPLRPRPRPRHQSTTNTGT